MLWATPYLFFFVCPLAVTVGITAIYRFLREPISAHPNRPPVILLSQENPLESPDRLLDRVQSLI